MNTYDFKTQLEMSKSIRAESLEKTIASMIPGVVDVVETSVERDKKGIDYVATLRGGAEIFIDQKARDAGCSRFWKDGQPEIALESWSVKPVNGSRGKVGWTLDESKLTHYTIHHFDPSDTDFVYLLPFHLLRKAYRMNYSEWMSAYRVASQDSGAWKSQCVFVPANVVVDAIQESVVGICAQPPARRYRAGLGFDAASAS